MISENTNLHESDLQKIAIISDSHDNEVNIIKALNYINKEYIKILIHCGDITASSTLDEVIIPNFAGEIHLVFGNTEDPETLIETVNSLSLGRKNVKVHGDRGEININGKKIGFCHFPDEAKKLALTNQFDIVFYGHTHKPWLNKIQTSANEKASADQRENNISVGQRGSQRKSVLMVNPGTLAGLFNKATFATYDTNSGKLELKILERI
jgi:hypothetical protein